MRHCGILIWESVRKRGFSVINVIASFPVQIALIFALIALCFVFAILGRIAKQRRNQREILLAGKEGEDIVTDLIRESLRTDDYLFTNVKIKWNDMKTELDNVVINKYGVFVIEAKNYNGTLLGREDSRSWQKVKRTKAGNQYINIVKNPFGQLKRQIYIFSNMLREKGLRVWINGYVYFVENNSPVESEKLLRSKKEINSALHPGGKPVLSEKTIHQLLHLFRKFEMAA